MFEKNPFNPIISIKDIPYNANSVMNPGATVFNNKVLLLLRVEDKRGMSHLNIVTSSNGLTDWDIDTLPSISPKDYPEEEWGIEDARITKIEGTEEWVIAYTSYSKIGPSVSLMITNDFKRFKRLGMVLPPDNKDAAIFPTKFGICNRWAMIHRIPPNIWIAFSDDLVHWGEHQVLLQVRPGPWWDAVRIGLASPPIRTKEGWLLFYHGCKSIASVISYRVGVALLDLKAPIDVIRRSRSWILGPNELHERVGDAPNVVFPCGVVEHRGKLFCYYGAADSSVCVATSSIDRVLWELKHQSI